MTYITEGQLRAIHRRVSEDEPPYHAFGPYHSLMRADSEPLIPGEVAELTFALIPTSVLFRRGHSIRVAIAGHDASVFVRVPETGTPVIEVESNSVYPSSIVLPVASGE